MYPILNRVSSTGPSGAGPVAGLVFVGIPPAGVRPVQATTRAVYPARAGSPGVACRPSGALCHRPGKSVPPVLRIGPGSFRDRSGGFIPRQRSPRASQFPLAAAVGQKAVVAHPGITGSGESPGPVSCAWPAPAPKTRCNPISPFRRFLSTKCMKQDLRGPCSMSAAGVTLHPRLGSPHPSPNLIETDRCRRAWQESAQPNLGAKLHRAGLCPRLELAAGIASVPRKRPSQAQPNTGMMTKTQAINDTPNQARLMPNRFKKVGVAQPLKCTNRIPRNIALIPAMPTSCPPA